MGKDYIKQFSKTFLGLIVPNLSDKQVSIRQEIVSSLDKISLVIGPEYIISACLIVLNSESPELRLEVLKWIVKRLESVRLDFFFCFFLSMN